LGPVTKVIVCRPKRASDKVIYYLGPYNATEGMMDQYVWTDKTLFVNTSTGHLRQLLCKSKDN
jgi:hypothetical protein